MASAALPSANVTVPVAAALRLAVMVTFWPVTPGLGLTPAVIPAANFMDWERTAEVEPASVGSPPYTAVMECVPCVRAEVVNEAEPFERAPVPSTVVPSRNCTKPAAEAGVTVARNDTAAPTSAGFPVEVSVVVVAIRFTVCINVEDWALM